jgi:mitogen-activated protein kinase 15
LLEEFRGHHNIITLNDVITGGPPMNELGLIFEEGGHSIKVLTSFLNADHRSFIIYQVLRALKYIHSAGVIHAALRPDFILQNSDDYLVLTHFKHAVSKNKKRLILDDLRNSWYIAPEALLNPRNASPAIDIWAVGCILAELYLGNPLFAVAPGEDQLRKIFETIGAPKGEDLLCYDLDYNIEDKIHSMGVTTFKSLREILRDGKPILLDFLEKALELNPRKRITAEEALKHKLFEQLHLPEDEPRFDFSKFGIDGNWEAASILDLYEESHQKRLDIIILAHNIMRRREALEIFPAEIWKTIFKFIELPILGSCLRLVDPIFSARNN